MYREGGGTLLRVPTIASLSSCFKAQKTAAARPNGASLVTKTWHGQSDLEQGTRITGSRQLMYVIMGLRTSCTVGAGVRESSLKRRYSVTVALGKKYRRAWMALAQCMQASLNVRGAPEDQPGVANATSLTKSMRRLCCGGNSVQRQSVG